MAVYLELSPRSIQLITPLILAVNEAMFIYIAVRNMKKCQSQLEIRVQQQKSIITFSKRQVHFFRHLGGSYFRQCVILPKHNKVNVTKVPET